jgi:flagellar motility protein MotE (MotC chaperone)
MIRHKSPPKELVNLVWRFYTFFNIQSISINNSFDNNCAHVIHSDKQRNIKGERKMTSYKLQILATTISLFAIIFILGCSSNNKSETSNNPAPTKTELPVETKKSMPFEANTTNSKTSPLLEKETPTSPSTKKSDPEKIAQQISKPPKTPKPTPISKSSLELNKTKIGVAPKATKSIDSEVAVKLAKSLDPETAAELAKSLDPGTAAELVKSLDSETAAELIKSLAPETAAELVKSLAPETAAELVKSLDPQVTTELAKSINPQSGNQTNAELCKNPPNMMVTMMCMMMPSSQHSMNSNASGTNPTRQEGMNFPDPNQPPKLQNLLLENLGPWDINDTSFGDLKYDRRFGKTIFDDFGMLHNQGQPDQYDNPTFEFRAPAGTILLAPVSGVVDMLDWQPSKSYTQDDWDLVIKPSQGSMWGINIDHIVSIDCDRTGATPVVCDLPLRVNGSIITTGSVIEAGQVLGYIGNWRDYDKTGINGRTELTVMKYFDDYSGVTNYCPTMYLDETIEQYFKSAVQELMNTYETWIGNSSIYNQEDMVAPGCRYSAITEIDGMTQPITD